MLASACGGGSSESNVTVIIPPASQNNTLTVSTDGSGQGLVTSSPSGINCGNDCSEYYSESTSITLQESAQAGSTFNGWTGAFTGMGECSFDMSRGRSLIANFTINSTPTENDLTVTVTGSGNVTSTPVGSIGSINSSFSLNLPQSI